MRPAQLTHPSDVRLTVTKVVFECTQKSLTNKEVILINSNKGCFWIVRRLLLLIA